MKRIGLLARGLARISHLEPPLTRSLRVERDVPVPMDDGVDLLSDRYSPQNGDGLPLVLMRTPYGRRQYRGYAELFASRGYQVVVQSCRGTFGSGGEFKPFQTDRDDGLATIRWLEAQPWFGGRVGMFGPSYMGFVQWAIAADRPDVMRAMSVQVGTSNPRSMIWPSAFSLATMLAWTQLVGSQAQGRKPLQMARARKKALPVAFRHEPLGDADAELLGCQFPFFQDVLRSESSEARLWQATDFSGRVSAVETPVLSLTGWYDIFLLGQLDDYARQRDAGKQPRLVVGPWGHTSTGWLGPALRETIRLFDKHLRDERTSRPETPVRVHLLGAREWRNLPDWPPPTTPVRLFPDTGGRLAREIPGDGPPDRYRYDPNDPTPSVGGNADPGFGSRDNRKLEARPDVVTYTTEVLPTDLDIMGRPVVDLYVRSSRVHSDFFARLCDVTPRGKSMNICDGIVRVAPGVGTEQPDGTRLLTAELWPTAYRVKQGHRLRLQVSSGAFPRFDRNPGTGEPIGDATRFEAADQEIFHDSDHPSALVVPVAEAPS